MKDDSIDAIFPRNFHGEYPVVARGEGVYLFDEAGKQYLDACGGAAVVTIGHGVREIVEQMSRVALELSYVHSSLFHSRVGIELAELLRSRFPSGGGPARVVFTSGGSEAAETAIKMVRQYWLSRGTPSRYRIISRWQSYHGATLGALALSGNRLRRQPYEKLLAEMGHISPCFCYRCPLGLEYPSCEVACADELQEAIERFDRGSVAAFIVEPVVGATTGAVPPADYLPRIREICDKNDILLIADEILVGAGRTGKYFAVEHYDVVPDIILLGKGLSSGYAPLGAVLAGEKVWKAIQEGTGTLAHGFTFQAHPPSLAAGLAVQRYIEKHGLIDGVAGKGWVFERHLAPLRELSCVGEIRGLGLLWTVEFVSDKKTKQPFPPEKRFVERLFARLRSRGVLVYPVRGTADGTLGEHIMLAPPFVVEESHMQLIAEEIHAAAAEVLR